MADEPRPVTSTQVTYEVADLLDRLGTRLDQGFSRIETKLDSKADKVDLARINTRLDEHGQKISRLEARDRDSEAGQRAVIAVATERTNLSQRRWNICLTLAMVLLTAGLVVSGLFH